MTLARGPRKPGRGGRLGMDKERAIVTHAGLSQVIGTALVDDGFRRTLLRNPREAVAPFDLASDEVSALARIRAQTLEQFAEQLVSWLAENEQAPGVV